MLKGNMQFVAGAVVVLFSSVLTILSLLICSHHSLYRITKRKLFICYVHFFLLLSVDSLFHSCTFANMLPMVHKTGLVYSAHLFRSDVKLHILWTDTIPLFTHKQHLDYCPIDTMITMLPEHYFYRWICELIVFIIAPMNTNIRMMKRGKMRRNR